MYFYSDSFVMMRVGLMFGLRCVLWTVSLRFYIHLALSMDGRYGFILYMYFIYILVLFWDFIYALIMFHILLHCCCCQRLRSCRSSSGFSYVGSEKRSWGSPSVPTMFLIGAVVLWTMIDVSTIWWHPSLGWSSSVPGWERERLLTSQPATMTLSSPH